MTKRILLILITVLISACTNMKVVSLDPKTGFFPTSTKAKVILSKPIELDKRKKLLIVPNEPFIKGSISNIEYFDEVIDIDELEKRIVQANLTEKVPAVNSQIGLNNAARHYKDFLWFHFLRVGENPNQKMQFILTDPLTSEDLFITETELDYAWKGVNDQYNWYPMYNSIIEYIKSNSKTYKK